MRIKFKILFVVIPAIYLFSSCESFFEVDDRERTDEEMVLSKDEDVAGMWAYLYHNFSNGFRQVRDAMLANACDEADLNQPFHAVQMFNEGSWNSLNNPENPYFTLYQGVRNACKFLESTDTMKNERFKYMEYYYVDRVKYDQLSFNLKAYRMDAELIKAYCHFELWKRYGDIAIVDKVYTRDEASALSRSSSADVVEYIVGKLDKIIPEFDKLAEMPESEYVNNKWSNRYTGRMTKGAALALKCRVLLYAASPLNTASGQYDADLCDQAAKAAAEIINMGNYSTNISYRDLQFNTNSENPENILDARITATGGSNYMEQWNYPLGGDDMYVNPSVGQSATCPSQNLVDAYETKDGAPVNVNDPYANRDPRMEATILCNNETFNGAPVESFVNGKAGIGKRNCTTTGYYLKKFVQNELKLPSGQTMAHIWYVFRYGEVLLNYAEAMYYAHGADAKKGYVTNGGDLSATDAVNLIRARKGVEMPARTTLTEEQLRNERRVELAFEGHRFWDVRRWKIAETTENQPLMGMRITKTGNTFTYTKEQIETRKFTTAMYRFPIPYTEMTNYPNWTQNSGWQR